MPTYLHPGVYVEEVPSAVKVIEGVGTSTAAFLGVAGKGPTDRAVRITGWSQFQSHYGSFMKDSDLAYAVFGFFANGGTACYVSRVNHGDADFSKTKLLTQEGNDSLNIKVISPGTWGNELSIEITDGNNLPSEEFNLTIYDGDAPVETFEDLSMTDSVLNYVGKMLNDVSENITVKDIAGPDNAVFKSTVNLAAPNEADLVEVYNVKIRIDSESQEINLSDGAVNKASVSAQHIVDKINEAFLAKLGVNVASSVQEGANTYIKIISPTSGSSSEIQFLPTTGNDATEDVFGLVEYSWQIDAENGEESFVEARGEAPLPISGGGEDLSGDQLIITLDGSDKSIPLAGVTSGDLETIIPVINGEFAKAIATTDGRRLIFKSENHKSMAFSGSAVPKLLGEAEKFYGYIEEGSGSNAAELISVADAATFVGETSRFVRIKFDNQQTIQVDLGQDHDFSSTITLDKIVENINAQVKSKTSIRKKVANIVDTKIKLTSPTTGNSSRIAMTHAFEDNRNLVSTDPVQGMFPVVITKQEFLSEEYKSKCATISGEDNLVTTNLDNSQLRLAIDSISNGESKSARFINSAGNTHNNVFEVIKKINDDLGVRDLVRLEYISDVKLSVRLSSETRGKNSYIQISIPQSSETSQHVTGIKNAAELIFGSKLPNPTTSPAYNFIFRAGIRRPANTAERPRLSGGTQDHVNVSNADIVGSVSIKDRNGKTINGGLRLFDTVDDMSLLSIPCVPPLANNVNHTSLISSGMSYCMNRKDCFFVSDIPHDKDKPEEAKKYVRDDLTASAGRDYTALYYPWISMVDPIGTINKNRNVPPSGHVAGLYARIDGKRGVWKAPAGTEAGLAATNSLVKKIIDVDQNILNPLGLNCIRQFPGVGIVSWGARTLGVKTAPEWKYVPIRRTAIMMRKSIYNGIQWAVFEPNDEPLWSSLKLNIGAFMNGLFRAGAFQGQKASDAYFVRCGLGFTMTQADIDRGQVIVEVGFAPLKPAEFVIVRIEQIVGQQV